MNETDHHTQQEIEKLETWLAGFGTPAPSEEAVHRARAAARREWIVQHADGSKGRWKVWHGSVAAAAAILLAVGVGWYAQSLETPVMWAIAEQDSQWMLPASSQEHTIRLAWLDDNLSEVETWIVDLNWDTDGASMYELIEEALTDSTIEPPSRGRDDTNGLPLSWEYSGGKRSRSL